MSMDLVEVKFTLEIAQIPAQQQVLATQVAKEAYVMTLLKQGAITQHRAAVLLGISRLDLAALLGKYKISAIAEQSRGEIEQELAQARTMLK